MSNEDLLKSFQVISELENRKITYEKAISKVEQEIENAGMWYREAEPIQPTQNLNHYWNKHSLRALLLFFILIPVFLLFFNAVSQYIYETFEYDEFSFCYGWKYYSCSNFYVHCTSFAVQQNVQKRK